MHTSSLRWRCICQALIQLYNGRALLEQPAAAVTRRAARCVTVAASGRPQQQRPGDPSRQQQGTSHQHEFDTIRREWHVRRTELRHFPEEVQQRIRASGRVGNANGSAAVDAAASSSVWQSAATTDRGQPAQPAGSSVSSGDASGRARQAELAADLQKLLAALEYERRTGYGNVIGSIERVPVADWANRQLLKAAGQLQTEPAASRACDAAAQWLHRYATAAATERQAAVAAAEAAAQAALQAVQVASRTWAGRHGRYGPSQAGKAPSPAATASQAQPPLVQQQQPQRPQARQQQQWQQQQGQRVAPVGAGGTGDSAAPAAAVPAEPAVPSAKAALAACATSAGAAGAAAATAAAGGTAVPEQELDAAAVEAHAEESGQQRHTPEGEEYVMQGGRRVKASTAAFRRSFAEAAAAAEQAAAATAARGGQAPLAALLAAGGEQRTSDWLRLRERRLTASAFSKAIGLFSGTRLSLGQGMAAAGCAAAS